MSDVIDAEVVGESKAVAVREEPASTALTQIGVGALTSQNPDLFVAKASAIAKALAGVINQQKLFVTIRDRKYVRVEGWTTLTGMLGVVPYEEDVQQQPDGSYIAIVSLRRHDGSVVTQASAECGSAGDEPWPERADYAKRSMAVTRATSKVCRIAYSWIITLAGYEATPAEEMPRDDGQSFDRGANTSGPRAAPADKPKCPNCGKVLYLSKYPDKEDGDKGFYCWSKKGGCGNRYKSYEILNPPDFKREPPTVDSVREGAVRTKNQPAPNQAPPEPPPAEPGDPGPDPNPDGGGSLF